MKKEKVLILGGGSRMGLATAKLLLDNNSDVIISSRTEDKLLSATKDLGQGTSYMVVDASNSQELETMLSKISDLDHIVVTVSAKADASSIINTTDTNAKQAFERFWISYNVLHFATKYLNRNGSVTLISGSSAKTPAKGYGVWGTLHGSINALVKQAAIDIQPIRVNAVSPGGIGIHTDRQLAEHNGQFEDIAKMIFAVITNKAVTSTIIAVDGGERLGTWNG